MKSISSKGLMVFGLLAGLMIGTGHPGGGLTVAVAAAAAAWMARAEGVHRDPH